MWQNGGRLFRTLIQFVKNRKHLRSHKKFSIFDCIFVLSSRIFESLLKLVWCRMNALGYQQNDGFQRKLFETSIFAKNV